MIAVLCYGAGVSWLPGLPSQVLQALSEVLDTPCFNRLLAACLTQTGEGMTVQCCYICPTVLAWVDRLT